MEKTFFIVACESIGEAVKVISFATNDDDNAYINFVDAVKYHMYDAGSAIRDKYLIGERGYEDWDFDYYLDDELEAGKFIHIGVYPKKNDRRDWWWGTYTLEDMIKQMERDYPVSKLISYEEFNKTFGTLTNDISGKEIKKLIDKCNAIDITEDTDKCDEIKNESWEDRKKRELNDVKKYIDRKFIKENKTFIIFNGLGFYKSIRKDSITGIEIKDVIITEENINKYKNIFGTVEVGEEHGSEVLIYTTGSEKPFNFNFSLPITDFEYYDDELANYFYNKLLNDIKW